MRKDMSKVVTEKPRSGSSALSRKTGGRVRLSEDEDADYGPSRFPISRYRQHGWDAKSFSDVLGPLRGYLRGQVGRPWDKVHSELSANLDRRSVSGLHIWDHVNMEVAQDTVLIGKKVFEKPRYGTYWKVSGLYVHPKTGLLCYTDERRWPVPPKPTNPDVVVLDDRCKLRRIHGCWFHVTEHKHERIMLQEIKGKVVKAKHVVITFTQKQLSKKELKYYGVSNQGG